MAHPVFAFDDPIRGLEPGCEIAVRDVVVSEDVIGIEGVEDRRQLVDDGTECGPGRAQRLAIRRRHEDEGLGVMLDLTADRDEDRLIGLDRGDDVLAGDVGRRDDDDLVPCEARVLLEVTEATMRDRRADRGAVPRSGEHEVVGVERLAGQLRGPLAPKWSGRSRSAGDDGSGSDDESVRGAAHRDGRRPCLAGLGAQRHPMDSLLSARR